MVCTLRSKLCNNIDCQICWDKSFASSNKAQYFDLEKNDKIPRRITKSCSVKYWFKCNLCDHSFESMLSNVNKYNGTGTWCPYCTKSQLCKDENCTSCENKSLKFINFYKKTWSMKNSLQPRNVSINSDKYIYMDCEACFHELYIAAKTLKHQYSCVYCVNKKVCDNKSCTFCFRNSLASYNGKTTNNKLKINCWNLEKNNGLMQRNVVFGTHDKHWFTCDVCDHDFEKIIKDVTSITKKTWCPYCSTPTKKLCDNNLCVFCFKNSLASYDEKTTNDKLKINCWNLEKNNGLVPRDVMRGSIQKYWFNCDICHHAFNKTGNSWCPYCSVVSKLFCDAYNDNYLKCKHCYNKSFANHEKSKYLDKNKNNNIDFNYVICNASVKYWFICQMCSHSFDAKLPNIKTGYWCPLCKNKTEKKLKQWFEYNNIYITYQPKYDWCINDKTNRHLPFDFVIEDKKLIIELDGIQHFKYVSKFNNNVEENILRDNYKTNMNQLNQLAQRDPL